MKRRPPRVRAPLVGRQHELALLEDTLSETISRRTPHAITIMGPAGVGKSRLLREFLTDVRAQHSDVRVYTGSSREGGPAFSAIRGVLRTRLGLHLAHEPAEQERVFRDAVTDVIGDRRVGEFLHVLGAFLDLELPESPLLQAVGDDNEQLRSISRTLLRRFLELDCANGPMVIALEEFHWAHEESLELMRSLIHSIRDVPLLFVVVARPELLSRSRQWMEGPAEALRFDLGPLDYEDATIMMRHLLEPTGAPPEELVDAAVDLAGGNPYLLEQMVRTYLRHGILIERTDGKWEVDLSRLANAQLPLSVDEAINARIAALEPEERHLLETAATVGGVFWLGALIVLSRMRQGPPELWSEPDTDGTRVAAILDDLIERDYLLEMPDSSIAKEREYIFKHNLEREALNRYTSRSLLCSYHLLIAQWLEFRIGDRTEEQCELLAQHYEKGGASDEAARNYLLAAERAHLRYAATRAADYFAQGLRLLGDTDSRLRMHALGRFGEALHQCGRSAEALSALEAMRALSYQLDLRDRAGAAHQRIGLIHRDQGKLSAAMQHLDTAQQLFDSAGDRPGSATTLEAMAMVQSLRGNTSAAEHMMQDALDTLRELQDEPAIARGYNDLGSIYRDAERFEDAETAFQQALALWRGLEDRRGVAESLSLLGAVKGQQGHDHNAVELWNEALEAARSVGDRTREAVILTRLGGAADRSGDPGEALSLLKQAEAITATLGDRMQEADTLRSLAKARAMIGDLKAAHEDVQRCIAIFAHAQSRPHLGVALRTAAEIAAAGDWVGKPALEPERDFEESIAIFEELGNDVELAHSCLALADHLGYGAAERADGADRARRAEQLRGRARELLQRRPGVSIRPSRIPRQG